MLIEGGCVLVYCSPHGGLGTRSSEMSYSEIFPGPLGLFCFFPSGNGQDRRNSIFAFDPT